MSVISKNIVLETVDGAGNTIIYNPHTGVENVAGAILTVNGEAPDEFGNVDLGTESDPAYGSLPIGFTFFSINPTLAAGMVEDLGQEVSRSVYANLWEWVKASGMLITEEEWQQKALLEPNNVPYYSNGDNATTFRMPCLRAYVVISGVKGAANEIKGRYCTVAFSNVTNAGNMDIASILTALNNLTSRVAALEAAK